MPVTPRTGTTSDGYVIHYNSDHDLSTAELDAGFAGLPAEQKAAFLKGALPKSPIPSGMSAGSGSDKSLLGFMANVPRSASRAVGDIASAVRHPIDTLGNVANVGVGAMEKGMPGGVEAAQKMGLPDKTKMADAVGQFYKDRYGGGQQIADTAYKDPVGMLLDALGLASGGGAALEGVGAMSKLEPIAQAGRVLSAVGAGGMPQLADLAAGRALRSAPELAQYPSMNLPRRMIDEGITVTPRGAAKAATRAGELGQTASDALDAAQASGTTGLPVRGPGGQMMKGPLQLDPALLDKAVSAGRDAQGGQVLSDAVGGVQAGQAAASRAPLSAGDMFKAVMSHKKLLGLGIGGYEAGIPAQALAIAAALGISASELYNSPAAMSRVAQILDKVGAPVTKYGAMVNALGRDSETAQGADDGIRRANPGLR